MIMNFYKQCGMILHKGELKVMLRRILSPVSAILIACFALFAGDAWCRDRQRAQKGDETNQFALAISGGVSLGSYEAGLNWAFVKHLKNVLKSSEQEAAARSGLLTVAEDTVALELDSEGEIREATFLTDREERERSSAACL